jgi:SagB-type dehydrogenase family enzyme
MAANLRPLVRGLPYRSGDALVFVVGQREVRVGGDLAFVQDVLARCDGRRSVTELVAELDADQASVKGGADGGSDARELVEALLEQGVIVDCSEAWRIFHAQSSVGSGLFRAIDEETVAALERQSFEPGGPLEEPVSLTPARASLQELAERRASATPGSRPRSVTFPELSAVLVAMYGRGPRGRRTVPSAGGLYPLAVHVLVRSALDSIEPGLWWYDAAHASIRLASRDVVDTGELILSLPLTDALLSRGHPVIFVSADIERPSRKYSNRAYRFALMEAGASMQCAYLAGAELGVPVRAVGGFDDDRVHSFLDLPGGAVPLLAVLLGS